MLKALVGFLAFTTMIAAGCTRTDSPRRSHETAGPTESSRESTGPATTGAMALSKKESVQIQQLEVVLSPERLEKQLRTESESDRQTLYNALKQAAATIEDRETSMSARAAIGRSFGFALLSGCTKDISVQLRSCRFLRLFKGQEAATTLAITAAQSEGDVLIRHSLSGSRTTFPTASTTLASISSTFARPETTKLRSKVNPSSKLNTMRFSNKR
ncbi:MAG: hypothetical protein IPJ84_14550 [Bdellovibrionales bacterium]|nr:hypothetical protein [Bdellovibrionales bacterium]